MLASWFNRGFLTLKRIDWSSSAVVLEKVIAYEAVHEIRGWDDLRRRLAPDRRCFAFFHPALPEEPLIFVEVALCQGLASKMQPLLSANAPVDDATQADTAIFYSISNCQPGLRGISFGNFLIKQVVEELRADLPGLNGSRRSRRYRASSAGWPNRPQPAATTCLRPRSTSTGRVPSA